MPSKEIRRWSKTLGQGDGCAVIAQQRIGQKAVATLAAECGRDADGEVIGQHRHQPLIKSAVVQRRQAKAVLRVEAVVGVFAPRDDVAGDHQLVMAQAANAAGGVVAGQNGFAEARLIDADLDEGGAGAAGFQWRRLGGFDFLQQVGVRVDAVARRQSLVFGGGFSRDDVPVVLLFGPIDFVET